MARGVHDVDARVLPDNGRAFGKDGDPAFPFQSIGIHGALGNTLIVAHGAGLTEHLVNERGLAMIDMGDDGDISQGHELSTLLKNGRADYKEKARNYKHCGRQWWDLAQKM